MRRAQGRRLRASQRAHVLPRPRRLRRRDRHARRRHPGLVRKLTLPQRSVEGRDDHRRGDRQGRQPRRRRPARVLRLRAAPRARVAVGRDRDGVRPRPRGRATARRSAGRGCWRRVRVVVVPVVNPDGFLLSRGGVLGAPFGAGPAAAQERRRGRPQPQLRGGLGRDRRLERPGLGLLPRPVAVLRAGVAGGARAHAPRSGDRRAVDAQHRRAGAAPAGLQGLRARSRPTRRG